jgi:hypothetical protein
MPTGRVQTRLGTGDQSDHVFDGRQTRLGVPAGATRTAALRQLVIQAPPPIVADALGRHNKHVTRALADACGTWKTYAPGDHSR